VIWAIYRIHYGTDFLKASIKSIEKHVDKIFIFYSERPWVITKNVEYKNETINFPNNPENVRDFISTNFTDTKFIVKNYECNTPLNQFGDLFNLARKITNIKPSNVLFMEPDMIFGKNQLKLLKIELKYKFWLRSLVCRQIEIWKFDKEKNKRDTYRIGLRKRRIGPVLWKINKNNENITTEFSGATLEKKKNFSNFVKILNMGFSFNKKTMLYKHILAIAASSKIGDSKPDENWYEKKWLNWNEKTQNLEISKGSQHLIKKAIKYKIPYKYYQFLNI
jgi:hypothetical protein